ncbi:hypothetical protein NEOLEDRAFT_197589 [Neolentinus lepideus HHB14362 ss-1]|uniref:Uncharacterized protein n=1 Tax=Neolentinus lepideus HHB14362 ss-1 TaxID=1314782 RepID=A0A165TGU7_9AGAM|nr:hypothetical protein NEOLEDRAFT_197589 [Neolentinus lepideus HHB14362 ss-1]
MSRISIPVLQQCTAAGPRDASHHSSTCPRSRSRPQGESTSTQVGPRRESTRALSAAHSEGVYMTPTSPSWVARDGLKPDVPRKQISSGRDSTQVSRRRGLNRARESTRRRSRVVVTALTSGPGSTYPCSRPCFSCTLPVVNVRLRLLYAYYVFLR